MHNEKMIQLELWEKTAEEKMSIEIEKIKNSCDRVRKKQFASIGEIRKLVDEIKFDLDNFKKIVCNTSN